MKNDPYFLSRGHQPAIFLGGYKANLIAIFRYLIYHQKSTNQEKMPAANSLEIFALKELLISSMMVVFQACPRTVLLPQPARVESF